MDPPTERPAAVVLAAGAEGGQLLPLGSAAVPSGPARPVRDLAAAVAEAERGGGPRWVLADVAAAYPALVRAGVRIGRCHDVAATEALLLAIEGDHAGAAAVTAARAGAAEAAIGQPALFEPGPAMPPLSAQALADAYAGQLDRIARRRAELPGLGLLVAAESASCLAAVEMTHAGLPWSAEVHDELLTELLGVGRRPTRPAQRPGRPCCRPSRRRSQTSSANPASTWTRRPTCCARCAVPGSR